MIATFLLVFCLCYSVVISFQYRIQDFTHTYNVFPASRIQKLFSSPSLKVANTEKSLYNKVLVKQKGITEKINNENLNKLKSFVDNHDFYGFSSHLNQWLLLKPPLPLLPTEEINEIIELTHQMMTLSTVSLSSIPIENVLNMFKSVSEFPEISFKRSSSTFSFNEDTLSINQEKLFEIMELLLNRLISEKETSSLQTSLIFLSSLTKLQFQWKMMILQRKQGLQRSFYHLITHLITFVSSSPQHDSQISQLLTFFLSLRIPLWEMLPSSMISSFLKSLSALKMTNSLYSRQILIVLNKLRYKLSMNEEEEISKKEKEDIKDAILSLVEKSLSSSDIDKRNANEEDRKRVSVSSFLSSLSFSLFLFLFSFSFSLFLSFCCLGLSCTSFNSDNRIYEI
jgi:hypothetical protein